MGVGSPKGGVGKTTITVNLAALQADAGARVLVIDADENHSASDWIDRAEAIPVDLDTISRPSTLRRLTDILLVVFVVPPPSNQDRRAYQLSLTLRHS